MKAVRIHRFGKPEVLQLDEIDLPKIGAKDLLVRVKAAGINPKDCLVRKGKYKFFSGSKFPMQLGEDLAGIVEAVGSAVTDLKKGEEVYGMINGWKVGAYAEYARIPAKEACLKPTGLSFAEAAGVPLAAQTALQALRDKGKIASGQKVFIHGASGGVGVFAVQIAKIWGAKVWASCSERNLDLVKSLGADVVLDYSKGNLLQQEEKFDLFFDSFGNQKFNEVKKILTAKGRYVTTIPTRDIILKYFLSFFTSQKASLVVVKSRRKDLELLKNWLENGKMRAVIDKIYPLDDVAEAHSYIETKRARGKVALEV